MRMCQYSLQFTRCKVQFSFIFENFDFVFLHSCKDFVYAKENQLKAPHFCIVCLSCRMYSFYCSISSKLSCYHILCIPSLLCFNLNKCRLRALASKIHETTAGGSLSIVSGRTSKWCCVSPPSAQLSGVILLYCVCSTYFQRLILNFFLITSVIFYSS